jgi:SAM-dependent methyltransferase
MPEAASMEVWTSGEGYERYVGRWSRLVANEFVRWLGAPAGAHWLDIGCGTGALVETILRQASPAAVSGIDRSESYVAEARRRLEGTIAILRAGDAQELPFEAASFDLAVSGLVLNFVPDQSRMVAEMSRAVGSGGMVAAYVWDYAGEMQMMRRFWDAAIALDPVAIELDEGRRFPVCNPRALTDLDQQDGLISVEVRPIDVLTDFENFDDFWEPFLMGDAPAPGYCLSLDEASREGLRQRLSECLPVESDGSIHLIARAWAIKGRAR